MKDILTLAEQDHGVLKPVSYELLAWGRGLADDLGVKLVSLAVGKNISDESLMSLIRCGADEVLTMQDEQLEYYSCETYCSILQHVIETYKPHTILAAATSFGRTVMPYAAVCAETGLTADCTGLAIDPETKLLLQTRPAIGGNIMATIKTPNHQPHMATVRPKSAKPLAPDEQRLGSITKLSFESHYIDDRVECVGFRQDAEDTLDLDNAEVIVAGGRGLKRKEHVSLVRDLASCFNGAVGASRDAVDRGWISYPHQVGLSGKTVSPRLYLAVGISGSVQQLAGIKTAEHIISVNSDPDANIHKVADIGVVADLFELVPRLTRRLKQQQCGEDL